MAEDPKVVPEQTGSKDARRDEFGRILPGHTLNPNGRPTGAESFATKWRRAIERIADINNTTPDEIEQQLLLVGFNKAKQGDYRFWGDVHDRVYGKPDQTSKIDVTTKGEKITSTNQEALELAKRYEQELKDKMQ